MMVMITRNFFQMKLKECNKLLKGLRLMQSHPSYPKLRIPDNLKDIECKDSYDSNLDESTLLVTHLSDANEDECFDPRGDIDEIDAFLDMDISTDIEDGYHDSEGDIIYLESLLNLSPEVLLDHDPKSLMDELEDLKSMVKVFDPGIWEIIFSPTYVKLPIGG
ncbi:hypothetical protein Tco_0121712 [Tanacetum coccineum]